MSKEVKNHLAQKQQWKIYNRFTWHLRWENNNKTIHTQTAPNSSPPENNKNTTTAIQQQFVSKAHGLPKALTPVNLYTHTQTKLESNTAYNCTNASTASMHATKSHTCVALPGPCPVRSTDVWHKADLWHLVVLGLIQVIPALQALSDQLLLLHCLHQVGHGQQWQPDGRHEAC